MYGMFAGSAHAFALIRKEGIDPAALAPLLADWLVAMAPAVHRTADQLRSGDYTKSVVSNLAMQVAGDTDLPEHRRAAGGQPGTAQPLLRADAAPPGRGQRRGGPDGRDRPAGALTGHLPSQKRPCWSQFSTRGCDHHFRNTSWAAAPRKADQACRRSVRTGPSVTSASRMCTAAGWAETSTQAPGRGSEAPRRSPGASLPLRQGSLPNPRRARTIFRRWRCFA